MSETKTTINTSGTHNYDGIDIGEGSLSFPKRITSSTEEGRAWFARGWMHIANFNHLAAGECFTSCTAVEPDCAMAWWGIGESTKPDAGDVSPPPFSNRRSGLV